MTNERRLWLVRHGETEGQSSIRYHGSNDVPLSDVGRSQIRALLPMLADVPFVQLVHSPMSRAAESAQLLLDGLALDPAPRVRDDERLREISFGDCEGMTREEIDGAHPTFWADYAAGKLDAFPGGEPRSRFAERVAAAVTELAGASDWRGDALLVAHRGIVKHALQTLLPETNPARDPDSFAVDLGSLSVIRQPDAGSPWTLELLGMTGKPVV